MLRAPYANGISGFTERETERDRQRQRGTERDKQIERETERDRERQRVTERDRERQTEIEVFCKINSCVKRV